jgi:5-methylcytosine-specific restriction protein A
LVGRLCTQSERRGRRVIAEVIDHIVAHRGDPQLFWDETNWQPLCKACHDHKTGRGG